MSKNLFFQLLVPLSTPNFYKFTKDDGKEWLLPIDNLSMGLTLYHPGTKTGTLFKAFLPRIHKLSFVQRVFRLETVGFELRDEYRAFLESVLGENNINIALYGGTPCADQKITLLLYKENRIVGFCKITESERVASLFYHEVEVLNRLKVRNVEHIQSVIACEKVGDLYCFVQSTEVSLRSRTKKKLSNVILNFLNRLEETTKVKIPYEESDIYKTISLYKQNKSIFSDEEQRVLTSAISKIEVYYADVRNCKFAVSHSDFTPWNISYNKNEIFVYDFEYARYRMMPYYDALHFIVQPLIVEKHYKAEKIYHRIKKTKRFTFLFGDIDIALTIYLVVTTICFALRDKESINQETERGRVTRIEMLKLLN